MDSLPPAIKALVPRDSAALLDELKDRKALGEAVLSLLTELVDSCYSGQLAKCQEYSKILLDVIWEKLNTGHWKDVNIAWRLAYSVVSFVKALTECCLISSDKQLEPTQVSLSASATPQSVLTTCDMGLLMGAPFQENILAKLAKHVQNEFLLTSSCGLKYDTSKVEKESLKQSCYGISFAAAEKDLSISGNAKDMRKNEDQPSLQHSYVNDELCDRRTHNTENRQNIAISSGIIQKDNGPCAKRQKNLQVLSDSCPSLETFRSLYMEEKCPVVINDAVGYWPALSTRKWSLKYITQLAGYRTVPIEIGSKYTEDTWTQKLMTIGEFIERYIEQRNGQSGVGYLAQHQLFEQIPELRDDICIPSYCSITDKLDDEEDVDINAWFGPCGTISPLHFDPKNNLLVQVVGEKYIQLYGEDQTNYLYPHSGRLLSNTSQVDVENPHFEKFPEFSKARFSECTLSPGQMLYIPPKCWHYVRSLDVSFSVSFWWS